MTLKRQLFIASLLMLIIPWAGLQFVLELDTALRQQAATGLEQQAGKLANLIDNQASVLDRQPAPGPVTYAPTLNRPLNLDGFGYDWPDYDEEHDHQPWQGTASLPGDGTLNWRVAVQGGNLYLLVRIYNRRQHIYDPSRPGRPFDELQIFLEQEQGVIERRLPSTGRGNVNALIPGLDGERDYRIRGKWESASNDGHQLELLLPRPDQGAVFGFRLTGPKNIGTDQAGEANPVLYEYTHSRLISRIASLEQTLEQLIAPGQNAWILEPEGWVIARQTQPPTREIPDFDSLTPVQILERISLNGLRALVRAYQPDPVLIRDQARQFAPGDLPSQGLVRHDNGDLYLLATERLANGRTLVLEESLDQMLTLSGSTLGSVIARSSLLLVGLMLVLLGYASWLSWRITRLQRAVSASIDEDGRLLRTLPPVKAKDELGDLSRQFTHLTERLHGYTHYLESFSQRLSHELKTPIAVVRSSLENLSQSTREEDRDNYLARAKAATDRLSQILHGMSEAARLEQSLDHAEKEAFDLADVCAQTTQAYQSLAPDFRVCYQGPQEGVRYNGSPELLVQLLDKLVDNARDFTPESGLIEVSLRRDGKYLLLSVFNEGSALPEELAKDIFSPFVSVRSSSHEGHLGQGLLIARLIAEHHGGRIQAANENGGVRFTVALPES
ncbi:ATP-binding protein [Marinobacter confluentis]|uniref:histidine kinase n=1 Tax=Marinobacter confluentis TaxID=1697557 RepID=A0A4Z1C1G4_9GAMM|nr:ATP-binding protein [Marinobacter confluentis]TGN38842.1 histidine kinase [Marinobacter confluentis]